MMYILSVRFKISCLLLIESIAKGTGSAVVVQAGHSWSELSGVQCFSDYFLHCKNAQEGGEVKSCLSLGQNSKPEKFPVEKGSTLRM